MKGMIIALAMLAAPAMAQVQMGAEYSPDKVYDVAISCIKPEAIRVAKASKESAELLGRVVVYRCSAKDDPTNRNINMWRSGAENYAIDQIVKARMGE